MSPEWIKDLPVLFCEKMSPERTGLVYSIYLKPDQIIPAAQRLYEREYYIEDVSGMDSADGFQVVYHFNHFQTPGRIALRVMTAHEHPEVPSIAGIFTGADWHERETHDFYGIVFTGHENLVPLLLPDDAGIHPLVKGAAERKKLCELMTRGEVEKSSPEVEALLAKPAKAEEGKPAKPVKEAGAAKSVGSAEEV